MIKNLRLCGLDIGEGVGADIEMSYTLNMDDKTVTIRENGAELDRLAEASGGAYTREMLANVLLTPTRIGTPYSFALSTTAFTLSSSPMLPGLIRILSAPFSMAAMARRYDPRVSDRLSYRGGQVSEADP